MKNIFRYFRLWKKLTISSFLTYLTSRFAAIIFLVGKSLRFIFFGVFLITLFTNTRQLAGYTLTQAIFFYLTFNVLDTATQLFFREVYRFRQLVVSGDFDLVLVKPFNPLFRALVGGADLFDLLMLIPYVGALVYVVGMLGDVSFVNLMLYVLLLINGLLISTGFHIVVLALGIITTEVDHAVMIYRDLTMMGRVPVDIYSQPLRSIITFAVPVGIMMTFPAKGFLGLLSPRMITLSLVLGLLFIVLSLRVWRYALSRYSSASS